MCAGARTSTANGRVGAECTLNYQVRVTQIYSVLTNKIFHTDTNHSFLQFIYCCERRVDSRIVMGLYGNYPAVSYRYCRSLLLLFSDPFFIQFHERAPYVALVKNRH